MIAIISQYDEEKGTCHINIAGSSDNNVVEEIYAILRGLSEHFTDDFIEAVGKHQEYLEHAEDNFNN